MKEILINALIWHAYNTDVRIKLVRENGHFIKMIQVRICKCLIFSSVFAVIDYEYYGISFHHCNAISNW